MSRKIMEQALLAFEAIMFEKTAEACQIIAKNARYALREELAKPEQEPVIGKRFDPMPPPVATVVDEYSKLLTAPPKQSWVGLTDDEILSLVAFETHPLMNRTSIVKVVEAKLREKNV